MRREAGRLGALEGRAGEARPMEDRSGKGRAVSEDVVAGTACIAVFVDVWVDMGTMGVIGIMAESA